MKQTGYLSVSNSGSTGHQHEFVSSQNGVPDWAHWAQEAFYGKEVIVADREMVESAAEDILRGADSADVAFLVVGDPFGCAVRSRSRSGQGSQLVAMVEGSCRRARTRSYDRFFVL